MSPLGKKIEPPAPEPLPEWRPYKPGMEIGPGGMLRTCAPPPAVDIDVDAFEAPF